MADVAAFPDRIVAVEPVPIDPSLTVGLNRHVEHPVAQQPVEEMRTVAEAGRSIGQRRLDDHPGGRDLAPLDRHAKALIGGPPSAETYEDPLPPLLYEAAVHRIELRRHHSCQPAVEVLRPQIDDIRQIVAGAVTEAVVRGHNDGVGAKGVLLHRRPLTRCQHRPNLEQGELHWEAVVAVEIGGDLDLRLAVVDVAGQLEQTLDGRSERDGPRLEERCKGQCPGPALTDPRPQTVRLRIVGRGEKGQRAISLRIFEPRANQTGGL